jgi:hypothetical protein
MVVRDLIVCSISQRFQRAPLDRLSVNKMFFAHRLFLMAPSSLEISRRATLPVEFARLWISLQFFSTRLMSLNLLMLSTA